VVAVLQAKWKSRPVRKDSSASRTTVPGGRWAGTASPGSARIEQPTVEEDSCRGRVEREPEGASRRTIRVEVGGAGRRSNEKIFMTPGDVSMMPHRNQWVARAGDVPLARVRPTCASRDFAAATRKILSDGLPLYGPGRIDRHSPIPPMEFGAGRSASKGVASALYAADPRRRRP